MSILNKLMDTMRLTENDDDYFDEEDYEEDFPSLEWYIQYGNGGTECSAPISEIGVSIFLSQKEAIVAAQHNSDQEDAKCKKKLIQG